MRSILIFVVLILFLCMPAMAQTHLTFAWDLSSDDAQLGTGGGYKIYATKTSGSYTGAAIGTVAPGISTVTVTRPGLGKWFFVATCFMADGTESAYSNEVNTVIKPAPPKLNTVQQIAQAIMKAIEWFAGLFHSKQQLKVIPA